MFHVLGYSLIAKQSNILTKNVVVLLVKVCSEKLVKVIVGKARTYFMKTAVYLAFREALMSRGRLNLLRKSEVWGLKRNSGAREEDKVEEVTIFKENEQVALYS
ncbi:hypothetical protein Tcan_08484 [Toxocara canis]|uniref:Uncharacterized protein n=1 Tax=Toxocara canis TaxID=6265 RepID=A0A0B2VU03_TOXCA|nr:hypothetical protein Tcan_08484 [Toxocara canis]